MRLVILVFFGLLMMQPAFAQEDEYQSCLLLAKNAPNDAVKSAQEWKKQGGGDPATHCEALAYMRLQQYGKAADILEALAKAQPITKVHIAANLYAQAAQAALKGGEVERALKNQDQGLKLRPDDVDLLVDRALLLGSTGNYFDALDDLNRAKDKDATRGDIYVLTASAYRSLDQLDLAKDALDRAFEINPNDPLAFLERGLLRKSQGDKKGAMEDFAKVIELAPNTPPADAASKHIKEIPN